MMRKIKQKQIHSRLKQKVKQIPLKQEQNQNQIVINYGIDAIRQHIFKGNSEQLVETTFEETNGVVEETENGFITIEAINVTSEYFVLKVNNIILTIKIFLLEHLISRW